MANLVRRHDPNRFQTALFAKADIREALFALYAFNVEMSRMGENLSEPLIGQMRLQWWVDLIEQMGAGTPPERGHPIGDRIGQVMGQGVIALLPLVEARQADLDESPFPELAAMELYADQTAGALAEQAALLLGADPITDQTELTRIRALGTAWGLMGLLRSVPLMAGRGRSVLPLDLMLDAGFGTQDLVKPPKDPDKTERLIALIAPVRERIDVLVAENAQKAFSGNILPSVLTTVLLRSYLEDSKRSGADLTDPALVAAKRMPLRLAWAGWRKRV